MKHILLTLSLILGLATPAVALDNAAQILSQGKILREYSESIGYVKGIKRTAFKNTYIVAYKKGVFECLVHELMEEVQCIQYGDIGIQKSRINP